MERGVGSTVDVNGREKGLEDLRVEINKIDDKIIMNVIEKEETLKREFED